ncbi:hypothetical protein DXG03_001340 [Asterophora parasitica]|uniref:Uncharacterized protein n=1 Tax=Asterophora parasitica TaxID=117018 RepID=A0A9P7G5G5_9AGAR|nr:hypothetical protein DXG03_001340 [Asterophora parasitica]
MSTIDIEIKSRFRWGLVFDYNNSDNSGSIVHEYKFKTSGSYKSTTYMETVRVITQTTAESHGLQLQTGASYGPISASISNSSNWSKELSDMLSNTTSVQEEKALEWSNEESRTYTVGAHSRVCLYQRSFEADGIHLVESVFRTTPEPLPKEELVEEDTIISQLVPRYTTNTKEALTRFDIVIQPDEDKRHDDLAKGAGGKFRYLIHVNQQTNLLITKAALRRSGSNGSAPDDWDLQTTDINKGRNGDYLFVLSKVERAWPV